MILKFPQGKNFLNKVTDKGGCVALLGLHLILGKEVNCACSATGSHTVVAGDGGGNKREDMKFPTKTQRQIPIEKHCTSSLH